MTGRALDRILAIQLRRLGDLVLATPAFHALKRARPGGRLTVLTEPPFDQVLRGNPDVDEVLLHPPGLLDSVRFGFGLRRRAFDAVIDFHANPTSARLAFQSDAPVRVGWARRGRGPAYTVSVPVPAAEPPRYTADQKLDLVRALGVPAEDAAPAVHPDEADRARGAALLAAAGVDAAVPFLVASPASRRAYKRWPPAAFAAVLTAFHASTGAQVLLACGPGEEDQLTEVARHCQAFGAPRPGPPGRTVRLDSPRDWVAVLLGARAFFGVDGGGKHLAQGLDRPTLALFGPQNWRVWTRPDSRGRHRGITARRPDCQATCSRREEPCPCLAGLSPAAVAAELIDLWTRVEGR